jgi:hypothetical protein
VGGFLTQGGVIGPETKNISKAVSPVLVFLPLRVNELLLSIIKSNSIVRGAIGIAFVCEGGLIRKKCR